ncbi:putative proline-rich receptor-like protein kinase PERK3 [Iris pallida]|uniref:Proline-rich receptor-like protein kinase PERK3 n=1 Tax=Iris pallida TaxID=29817 RepID=A0AAX6HF63_IRIPA|nr:putative proline-rich receptor-like protein kinase PERK3 [Iris pallida]
MASRADGSGSWATVALRSDRPHHRLAAGSTTCWAALGIVIFGVVVEHKDPLEDGVECELVVFVKETIVAAWRKRSRERVGEETEVRVYHYFCFLFFAGVSDGWLWRW